MQIPNSSSTSVKISSDGTTAVDTNYFFQSLETCPRGVGVQLLTIYGKAIDGQWTGQKDVVGWAPYPKVPAWMKKLLK